YTWCRRADDAVDEAPAGDGTIERLDDELVAAYEGRARDPVLAAFGDVARDRGIPLAYPRELLAGMAMDVRGSTYVTVDDVIVYAWRVAGVVGLMMTHVFGVADDAALVPAAHLGIAMQLTNICRDVGEDARRGRVYLPQQWVDERGLQGARQELLALADRYYASADSGMTALPWRAALAVRAARNVYAAIGARITTSLDRAVVPGATKLALVARALGRTTLAAPRHLLRRYHVPTHTLELADVPRL
ncbi:MAG TPA: phytoene/squalene synthase family protein, partial [Kofleriaceae bacterium]